MKAISIGKRSSVFYNEDLDIFIKKFNPSFKAKLKYFFKLRKYPGENFNYISKLLRSLDIKTANIVSYGKYEVHTKNIHGISLEEAYKENPKLGEKYIFLVLTLLKYNIYSGDLSLDNFIVKDNDIYVIDMEDYRHTKFFNRSQKEFIRRLNGKIPQELHFKLINCLNIK